LSRHPVTNAEYRQYIGGTRADAPSHMNQPGFDRDDQPVVGVSWNDASAYCRWLAAQTGLPCRLPSDPEWEYAARGDRGGTLYPWGDDLSPDHACYDGLDGPAPVGNYAPNGFGLFDMVGNVWEWCLDRFNGVATRSHAVNTPTGRTPTDNRCLRGGSFLTDNPLNLRIAYRHEDPMDLRHECIGFRVAADR